MMTENSFEIDTDVSVLFIGQRDNRLGRLPYSYSLTPNPYGEKHSMPPFRDQSVQSFMRIAQNQITFQIQTKR